MVASRTCFAVTKTGAPCGATPMHAEEVCFFHHPEESRERGAYAAWLGSASRSAIAQPPYRGMLRRSIFTADASRAARG